MNRAKNSFKLKFNIQSILILIMFIFLARINVNAQSLYFFDMDISKYPLLSSKYIYLDQTNNYKEIKSPQDFKIKDNNLDLEILTNTEGGQLTYDFNEIVIAFDLSIDSSRNLEINQLESKFELSHKITQNLIENTNFEKSSITLLTYDYKTYPLIINSQDKSQINSLLNLSTYYRYASIDSLFNSNPISIINIFNHKNFNQNQFTNKKRTVLLITDKNIKDDNETLVNYQKILNDNNINLVVCLIGTNVNENFKNLIYTSNSAENGFYLEIIKNNCTNEEISYYSHILSGFVNGVRPSELKWLGKYNCDMEHITNVETVDLSAKFDFNYKIKEEFKPRFSLDKPYINFSSILPNNVIEEDIYFTAENTDIAISNFEIERDYDTVFTIIEGQIVDNNPIVITKGLSHKIRIRYKPIDSTIVFIKLIARSTACIGKEVLITGGFPNTPPKRKNVEIVTPQCTDVLFTGDTALVKWAGVLPKDVIQLEYSLDYGITWDTLGTNLTELEHKWKVPNIESDKCLVRIVQLWPNNIGRTLNLMNFDLLNSAKFNTIGDKIVTASKNGDVIIWNSNNGQIIRKLIGHKLEVYSAEFNFNGTQIVTASEDSTAKVWNVEDGKIIFNLVHDSKVTSATFSPKGDLIATSSANGAARIYDTKNGKLIKEFYPDNTIKLNSVNFTSDNKTLITAGHRGLVKFWDLKNLRNTSNLDMTKLLDGRSSGKTGQIIHTTISPNDDKLAAVDQLNARCAVWDLKTDKILYFIYHFNNSFINSASFYYSTKDSFLITSGVDSKSIVWHARTGDSIKVFLEHNKSVQSTYFNFDGSRVLTSSWDSTAKIWKLDQRDLQMDTSDCVFTIAKPVAQFKDIILNQTLVNENQDFYIKDFLINKSNFGYDIKSINIIGNDKDDFEILEFYPSNSFILANDTLGIKLRFKPSSLGNKRCEIIIAIPGQTISIKIESNSISHDLSYSQLDFDFGDTEIGDFKNVKLIDYIKNSSVKDIDINSVICKIPNQDNFRILEKGNVKIQTNQTSEINIRFIPMMNNSHYSVLEINHTGNNSPAKMILYGNGLNPNIDSLELSLNPISGNNSNIVELLLNIKKISQNKLKSNLKGIKTKLTFNSTMLKPIEKYDFDEIIGNERIIEITVPFDESQAIENKLDLNDDVIVYKVPFLVALGNDTMTTIKLENSFALSNGNMALFENSTTFNLTDYCTEGGSQLLINTGILELGQNYPNPANTYTKIEFNIVERGNTKLFIQNLNGEKSLEIFNKFMTPNDYIEIINTQSLPSGVYNIILETPTQKITKRINIVH